MFVKCRKQSCRARASRESGHIMRNGPERTLVRRVDSGLGGIYCDPGGCRGNARGRKKRCELAGRARAPAGERRGGEGRAGFSVTLRSAALGPFCFVLDPEVPTTGRSAEQLLREPVVVRKMRGRCAQAGAPCPCALPACTTAWARQGPVHMAELKKAF